MQVFKFNKKRFRKTQQRNSVKPILFYESINLLMTHFDVNDDCKIMSRNSSCLVLDMLGVKRASLK